MEICSLHFSLCLYCTLNNQEALFNVEYLPPAKSNQVKPELTATSDKLPPVFNNRNPEIPIALYN
jgi:hypothetical protein